MTPQQQLDAQIQQVTQTVTRIVTALTGFLLSLPLLGTAITAVVGIIGGFGLALRSATSEATALARSLSAMRAANGYSFAQGYAIQRQFGAIGISRSETAGIFSQPGNSAFGFGLRGVNPSNLAGLAAQYQATANGGIFGRQIANARLDSQFGGSVPPALREALSNLSPNQIRGAQNYSDRINGSLGIDPNRLKEFVTTLPLVEAKIGGVINAIKVRFATEALPLIEKVLGDVADYLAANADKIAATIRKITTWLVFEMPIGVLRAVSGVAHGFSVFLETVSVFTKGLSDAIPGIVDFAKRFLDVMSNIGTVIGKVTSWIATKLGILSPPTGPDVAPASGGAPAGAAAASAASLNPSRPYRKPVGNPFIDVAAVLAAVGIGAGIGATTGGIAIPLVGSIPGAVVGGLAGGLGVLGTLAITRMLGRVLHNGATNAAAADPTQAAMPGVVASRMVAVPPLRGAGAVGAVQRLLNGASNGEHSAAQMLDKISKGATAGADSWQTEMLNVMKGIESRTGETAKNTSKEADQEFLRGMTAVMIAYAARVSSNLINDQALNVLHVGGG